MINFAVYVEGIVDISWNYDVFVMQYDFRIVPSFMLHFPHIFFELTFFV